MQAHTSPDVKSSGRAQKRSKSSSQRRTKRKVFDERQTDEERRLLRVEQRNINHVLATGGYRTRKRAEVEKIEEDLEDDPLARPTLEGVRDSNNELFRHVTYTRELVLDADNVALLANNYAKQVEQSVQVRMCNVCLLILFLCPFGGVCRYETHFCSRFPTGSSLRCCQSHSSAQETVHGKERK